MERALDVASAAAAAVHLLECRFALVIQTHTNREKFAVGEGDCLYK